MSPQATKSREDSRKMISVRSQKENKVRLWY